jgi:hypothetical protein
MSEVELENRRPAALDDVLSSLEAELASFSGHGAGPVETPSVGQSADRNPPAGANDDTPEEAKQHFLIDAYRAC